MKQPLTLAAWLLACGATAAAQPPAGQQPQRATASVNTQPRVDVLGMARPIEMHDTVWIEDLTTMEVRDLLKAGKTTALVHDDHYITALIAVHDPNGVRMPERIKAGKFAINGVSLAPLEKTVENGRRIAAFRTERTVAAIKKAMAAARAAQ